MFIYSFKEKGPFLLEHVVISGNHLTVYTRQSSLELQPVINRFNLSGVRFAEDPKHPFLHHPFIEFSKQGDVVPHKHLKFHLPNRLEALAQICQFLVERQNNSELRKQDFEELKAALDAERRTYGDKELPAAIQQRLREYDCQTPYLPEIEVSLLLTSFEKYICSDGLPNMAENLAVHAEELMQRDWEVLYHKRIWDKPDTPEEQALVDYYKSIVDLRFFLLKISIQNEPIDYFYANELAKEILKSAETPNSIINNLRKIIDHTTPTIKRYERRNGLFMGALILR